MTVRVYKSTDADAPVLTGQQGSLIPLLKACLVDGYGEDADAKPGAGWTMPFEATNKGVFRQGRAGGMYLRLDDTNTQANPRHARVRGYKEMTGVDSGVAPFPDDNQRDGGVYFYTHNTGSYEDSRTWVIIADETFFYLMINIGAGTSNKDNNNELYWFGDIVRYGPNDQSAVVLQGQWTTANTSQTHPMVSVSVTSTVTNFYAAGPFTNLGNSVPLGHHIDGYKAGTTEWGKTPSAVGYPHGPDGALLLSPVWVHEPANGGTAGTSSIRGYLPGLWAPLNGAELQQGDSFPGYGPLEGKEFFCWRHNSCRCLIETSDTWR